MAEELQARERGTGLLFIFGDAHRMERRDHHGQLCRIGTRPDQLPESRVIRRKLPQSAAPDPFAFALLNRSFWA
jgi:hypothetical protein